MKKTNKGDMYDVTFGENGLLSKLNQKRSVPKSSNMIYTVQPSKLFKTVTAPIHSLHSEGS